MNVMLGIKIQRSRTKKQLFISQPEYTREILARFGMENSKPLSTPMVRPEKSIAQTESTDVNIPYREAIGSLMYLMIGTRPDIAYAVGKLAQHSQNPKQEDWTAVKRVFRYIKGTADYGILYTGTIDPEIIGFSDSDHAGCLESRKSTSGYIFQICGRAISWRSKKQTAVATSSCEAEYIASCLASKEAIWLSRLHCELVNLETPDMITIGVDNDGSINMAKNVIVNDRSKHIDTQYHFVRDCVTRKKISLSSCQSNENLADPLTKPLNSVKHSYLTQKQGVYSLSSLPASLKGEC